MNYPLGRKLLITACFMMSLAVARVFADTEIDLGDNNQAPVAKPTAAPVTKPAAAPITILPLLKANPTPTVEISESPTATPAAGKKGDTQAEESTPVPEIIHGTLKMKDIYAAGIKNYQDQDYDAAIRYLKKSLEMKDEFSQKFYYAEAAAMLGVIYQFHVIHYDQALHFYKLALKYEKGNRTAKKHLKEVQRLIQKGE